MFSFLVLTFALGVSGLGVVLVWFGVVCGCLFLLGWGSVWFGLVSCISLLFTDLCVAVVVGGGLFGGFWVCGCLVCCLRLGFLFGDLGYCGGYYDC